MALVVLGLEMPNTDILHYQLEGGSADELHGHDEVHQISLPLFGRPSLLLDTEKRDLTGDLRAITSPGHRHRNFAPLGHTRLLVLNLSPRLVDAVYQEHTDHGTPVEFSTWANGTSAAILRHVDSLLRLWTRAPGELLETEEWERELARLTLNLHPGSHADRWRKQHLGADHLGLKRALSRIRDEFHQELSLDDLASAAKVSKSHLIRLFHIHLGQTPSQYLTGVRLSHAVELLVGSGRPATEIAFACGFGSISSFERAFRQRYGTTPAAYRRAKQ